MSDRFPGEITIGGRIPRRLLDTLAGMIASEGVSIDWQYALDKAAVRAAIEAAAAKGETVRFTNDEAAYGEFLDLEGWLTSHGIHFDRHSDARYEYDGENAYHRGGRKVIVMPAGQNGDPQVRCQDILKILDNSKADKAKLDSIRRLVAVCASLKPVRIV
jgi:hypothetical protein